MGVGEQAQPCIMLLATLATSVGIYSGAAAHYSLELTLFSCFR